MKIVQDVEEGVTTMYKTGKKFEIELVDPKCEETGIDRPRLYNFDCPNILEQFKDRISDDECVKALDTLIAYFVQENISKMEVNIDERDESLAPEKEMTIDEMIISFMKSRKS